MKARKKNEAQRAEERRLREMRRKLLQESREPVRRLWQFCEDHHQENEFDDVPAVTEMMALLESL